MTDGLILENINQQLLRCLSFVQCVTCCVVCVCRDTCRPPPCRFSEDHSPVEKDGEHGCCLLLLSATGLEETKECVQFAMAQSSSVDF